MELVGRTLRSSTCRNCGGSIHQTEWIGGLRPQTEWLHDESGWNGLSWYCPGSPGAEPLVEDECCDKVYTCPTSGQRECGVHGGFDRCCANDECPGSIGNRESRARE